uniref:Putative group II intron reverse transcriptase/maturase protein n=1 Tax=Palmaria palmata TaxID=2822 RepID=A0A455TN46_PALPL|nr:putative group II intron reverse transcriptase/maturase protein [Palmaria palmata]
MSKEIKIYFNTVFWSSTHQENLYLYISSLKSKIYKSASQNNYSKMHKLQDQLIASPSARIIALNLILEKLETDNKPSFIYPKEVYLSGELHNLEVDINKYLDRSFSNKKNVDLKYVKSNIINLVLIEAIKPYCNAIKDKTSNYLEIQDYQKIVPLVNNVVAERMLKKDYLCSLNLETLLHNIDRRYLFARISTTILASEMLKRYLKSQLLVRSTKHAITSSYVNDVNPDLQLVVFIFSFLCYLVSLETSYLLPLPTFYHNTYNLSLLCTEYSIISCQGSIMLYGKSKQTLNFLLQSFTKITSQHAYLKTDSFCKMSKISLVQCYFHNYFLARGSNNKFYTSPSKDSQRLLLYQINIICTKFKGDSLFHLTNSLNITLKKWMAYFGSTNKQKIFTLLDYLIYLKLRSLISKRQSNISDLEEKYPSFNLRLLYLRFYSIQDTY